MLGSAIHTSYQSNPKKENQLILKKKKIISQSTTHSKALPTIEVNTTHKPIACKCNQAAKSTPPQTHQANLIFNSSQNPVAFKSKETSLIA